MRWLILTFACIISYGIGSDRIQFGGSDFVPCPPKHIKVCKWNQLKQEARCP